MRGVKRGWKQTVGIFRFYAQKPRRQPGCVIKRVSVKLSWCQFFFGIFYTKKLQQHPSRVTLLRTSAMRVSLR